MTVAILPIWAQPLPSAPSAALHVLLFTLGLLMTANICLQL